MSWNVNFTFTPNSNFTFPLQVRFDIRKASDHSAVDNRLVIFTSDATVAVVLANVVHIADPIEVIPLIQNTSGMWVEEIVATGALPSLTDNVISFNGHQIGVK